MIESIRAWFETFVAGYRMGNPSDDAHLELKRTHCLLVMAEAQGLASELALSPRMAELAVIAGLCHDVGRFPQYRRYRTFRDADSANHALLGTQALARHDGLAGLGDRDRRLVRLAVAVHNRRSIPRALLAGGDQEALVLARIVRDADKLDIVRVMLEYFATPTEKDSVVFLGLPDLPDQFTPSLLDDIEAGRIGSYAAMRSVNDFALLLLSWINDMTFARSRRLFFERGQVRALFAELPDLPRIAAFKTHYYERFAPAPTSS